MKLVADMVGTTDASGADAWAAKCEECVPLPIHFVIDEKNGVDITRGPPAPIGLESNSSARFFLDEEHLVVDYDLACVLFVGKAANPYFSALEGSESRTLPSNRNPEPLGEFI